MESTNTFGLHWILTILNKYKILFILSALIIGGLGFYLSRFTPPLYASSIILMVDTSRNSSSDNYNDLAAGERLALTYSQMINSPVIINETIHRLSLSASSEALKKNLKVENIPNTQLIKLTVSDADPAKARLIADTIAEIFSKYVEKINSTRYSSLFADNNDKKVALQKRIEQTKAQIDTLNSQKVNEDIKLAKLNNLLVGLRNDYQQLQQNYQSFQLVVSQIKGKVTIVDSAEKDSGTGPIYTSTATFLLDQGTNSNSNYTTYSQIIKGQAILEAVITKMGLKYTVEDLKRKMRVEQILDTQMMRLTFIDTDADLTKSIANSIANEFVSQVKLLVSGSYVDRLDEMQNQLTKMSAQIDQYQTEIGSITAGKVQIETDLARENSLLDQENSDLRVLDQEFNQLNQNVLNTSESVLVVQQAETPTKPTINRPLINSVVGSLIGILLAALVMILIEAANDKIKDSQNLKQIIDIDTVCSIGRINHRKGELVLDTQKFSPIVDDFHNLGTNLRFIKSKSQIKTLLVTSPNQNEGKTLIAANLALEMAQTGLRVILIDADLRLPRLYKIFGVPAQNDLASLLSQPTIQLDGHLQNTRIERVQILTSGIPKPDGSNVINFHKWPEMIKVLEQAADLIIIDSAPILSIADAKVIASYSDSVLLVLRANKTNTQDALDAAEYFQKSGTHMAGIVLNDAAYGKERYSRYKNPGNPRKLFSFSHIRAALSTSRRK